VVGDAGGEESVGYCDGAGVGDGAAIVVGDADDASIGYCDETAGVVGEGGVDDVGDAGAASIGYCNETAGVVGDDAAAKFVDDAAAISIGYCNYAAGVVGDVTGVVGNADLGRIGYCNGAVVGDGTGVGDAGAKSARIR